MRKVELLPGTVRLATALGMANDGEWRTGQYLVEGVKAIKCFHPRMLTPLSFVRPSLPIY